jgi:hypothetical protein
MYSVFWSDRKFLDLLPLLTRIGRDTPVIWVPQNVVNETRRRTEDDEFTNANMKMYNDAILSALKSVPDNRVTYWHSYESTFRIEDSLDGIHIGPIGKHYDIQILINLLCNSVMQARDGHICCTSRQAILQKLMKVPYLFYPLLAHLILRSLYFLYRRASISYSLLEVR